MNVSADRRVLVSGASRGIGRAIAARLLRDGHEVVGIARGFEDPSLAGAFGERFRAEPIDLADLDRLPAKLERLRSRIGEIDALVLAAGRGDFGHLEQMSYAAIRSLVDLDFTANAFVTRAFVPELKRRAGGDIVFVGSEAALAGKPKGSVYCASKFALRGFAQALRQECAASDVRVSIVQPGMVRSEFFDDLDFEPGEDVANALMPDDVADAIAWILAAPRHAVCDEIVLSPLKRVVRFRKRGSESE